MTAPKHVAEVVANMKPRPAPVQTVHSVEVDPGTQAVIDDLFTRLKGIFPAWKQAWPTKAEYESAQDEWLAEFMRAGISRDDQIQHGIRMAAKHRKDFVPPVGVFVGWCFAPEAFGLPVLDRAFAQALRNTHPSQLGFARWSHAAVYHAAVATGFYSLQRLDRALGLKRFEEKYLEQCRKLGRGDELPPMPVAALPSDAGPRTPEVGNAALKALRGAIKKTNDQESPRG